MPSRAPACYRQPAPIAPSQLVTGARCVLHKRALLHEISELPGIEASRSSRAVSSPHSAVEPANRPLEASSAQPPEAPVTGNLRPRGHRSFFHRQTDSPVPRYRQLVAIPLRRDGESSHHIQASPRIRAPPLGWNVRSRSQHITSPEQAAQYRADGYTPDEPPVLGRHAAITHTRQKHGG